VGKIKSLGFKPRYDIKSGVEKTFNDVERMIQGIPKRDINKCILILS